jgi:transposase-like protein
MKKIAKSKAMLQEVQEVYDGLKMEAHPLDAFVKLGARYMLQTMLEREMTEFLGRNHYRHGRRGRDGWRNGYESKQLKTGDGNLKIFLPQVRGSEEKFQSKLMSKIEGGSEVLRKMVLEMYVKGLSTRDVESLFVETFGNRVISKSGVSEMAGQLTEDFNVWRKRDLSDLKILYLFIDGIYLPARQGIDIQEAVLGAYAILESGEKVLLHLTLGGKESYDACLGFLHDMTARGLQEPLLVIYDGCPGLKKAIREVFPNSKKQRCQVHRMRNILSKLPKTVIAEMKRLIQQVFLAPSYDAGMDRGKKLIARFGHRYPQAMECLEETLSDTLTYLQFPKEHWKFIRTTNLLERTWEEVRRRTKVIPRFPTETSCLKLVYSVLIGVSKKWYGIRITPKHVRMLDKLREKIFSKNEEEFREIIAA